MKQPCLKNFRKKGSLDIRICRHLQNLNFQLSENLKVLILVSKLK